MMGSFSPFDRFLSKDDKVSLGFLHFRFGSIKKRLR